jgi:hypothetical protein
MNKTLIVVIGVMLTSRAAVAASIPAACEAAKQQEAGALRQCLHKAEQKLVTSGDPGTYGAAVDKCTGKFSAKWQLAEEKAIAKGGSCPSVADASNVESSITANVAYVTTALDTGDTTRLGCGNGVVDPGEDCDLGPSFGGATCASASGGTLDIGTLACDTDCALDTSACKHCPGQLVGGYCWLYGATGLSCDDTCAGYGLAYDPATGFYAGASGNNAKCVTVLDALGVPPSTIANSGPPAAGCSYVASVAGRFRDIRTTTSGTHYTSVRRACACR